MLYPETNPPSDQQPKMQLSTINERKSFGSKLYVAAWVIEILAALIGLAVSVVMGFQSHDNFVIDGVVTFEEWSDIILGSIPFFMVAVVELLKIPMVYLIYTSPSFKLKVAFSLILFGLTFITFETVASGFERQYTSVTEKVNYPYREIRKLDKERIDIEKSIRELKSTDANTISEAFSKLRDSERTQTNKRIQELEKQIVDIQSGPEGDKLKLKESQLKDLEAQRDREINQINLTASQSSDNSKEQIRANRDEIKDLRIRMDKNKSIIDKGGIFCIGLCNVAKEENKAYQQRISQLQNEQKKYRYNINDEISSVNNKYENQISSIRNEISALNEKILAKKSNNFQVDSLQNDIKKINERFQRRLVKIDEDEKIKQANLKASDLLLKEKEQRLEKINPLIRAERKKLDDYAATTQLYRFAKYWKQFWNAPVCEQWQTTKEKQSFSIVDRIFNGAEEPKCLKYREYEVKDENDETIKDESGNPLTTTIPPSIDVTDVTEDDVTEVAFVWFGSLAFLVAIMGSVVAYGAFVLKYPRKKHYLREESHWSLTKTLRNLFAAWLKKMRKPRPVKNIEVEVIKEVPVDKVAFKEVPVEVVKKEVVHTPIYTNDPDLLKFGTTNIKDILKKKKKTEDK